MGWWSAGEDGSSLHEEPTGLLWGDGPADIIDEAIDRIIREFKTDIGRHPYKKEIIAGLSFSLSIFDENMIPEYNIRVLSDEELLHPSMS